MYLTAALEILCHFGVTQAVPLEGEISLADLAAKTKLPESIISRCLKMVVLNQFFSEPIPGVFSHSARSKLLATDEGMRVSQFIVIPGFCWDKTVVLATLANYFSNKTCPWMRTTKMMPSIPKVVEAIKK
jgi:hypothetical protein